MIIVWSVEVAKGTIGIAFRAVFTQGPLMYQTFHVCSGHNTFSDAQTTKKYPNVDACTYVQDVVVAPHAAGLVLCRAVAALPRQQLGGAALRQVHHPGQIPQEFCQRAARGKSTTCIGIA